jgi:hypothetical protein
MYNLLYCSFGKCYTANVKSDIQIITIDVKFDIQPWKKFVSIEKFMVVGIELKY